MIDLKDIAICLHHQLDTGSEDAQCRIGVVAAVLGYPPNTVKVDDLDAHEIYEIALSQSEIERNLILHQKHQDERGQVRLHDLSSREIGY